MQGDIGERSPRSERSPRLRTNVNANVVADVLDADVLDAEEEELQRALRESALCAEKKEALVLDSRHQALRSSITRVDKHASGVSPVDGDLLQIDCLHQFHHRYIVSSCQEFNGPRAICGFFSCAYALLLEEYLAARRGDSSKSLAVVSRAELAEMVAMLTDINRVDPVLRQAMAEVIQERDRFYSDATSERRAQAQREEVANYEIGDFLMRHSGGSGSVGMSKRTSEDAQLRLPPTPPTPPLPRLPHATHFFRMNEYPFRKGATADHAPRLLQEARFGGREEGSEDVYEEGDSVYFVQTSFASRQQVFLTPEEFVARREAAAAAEATGSGPTPDSPQVVVVDLEGHFVCGLACLLAPDESDGLSAAAAAAPAPVAAGGSDDIAADKAPHDTPPTAPRKTLILFNTTPYSYIAGRRTVAWTFDGFFPARSAAAGRGDEGLASAQRS